MPVERIEKAYLPRRLHASLEEAARRLCGREVPDARLRGALAQVEARAFELCAQGACATCDQLWGGVACAQRRVRKLVKRAVMAVLPIMERRCTLEVAWAEMDQAVAAALEVGASSPDLLSA